MAEQCGFFDAQMEDGELDRVYNAEHFAAYFASFIGNGVFGDSMMKLHVGDISNKQIMAVEVAPGEAFIRGYWYRNTDMVRIPIDVTTGLSRIDVVVLRLSWLDRNISVQLIKGEEASNPIKPDIVRNLDYYDLQLAVVNVSSDTRYITQSQIQDTRLDKSLCGLVTGVVDKVDMTGIFRQFNSYFEEFKDKSDKEYADFIEEMVVREKDYRVWFESQKSEFENWFDTIKDTLPNNYIANLQQEIGDIKDRLANLENLLSGNGSNNSDGDVLLFPNGNNNLTI